ncbi:MAG: response regulator transcription factor [bacterium]|nr:response regulator transcription factor [bacterium]
MYRVIIVDDEPMARERIHDLLLEEKDIEICGQCRNGVEAVKAINGMKPDLVFLDIQMPGMNGFDVLGALEGTHVPEIIFVTAYDQYTLQAFTNHALDYLLKPFDDDRFKESLDYARKRLDKNDSTAPKQDDLLSFIQQMKQKENYIKRLQVKVNRRIIFLNVENIDSFEAEGYYVRIRSGAVDYLVRNSLNQLAEQLDPKKFARIHRSTIINIDSLRELQQWSQSELMAILKNGGKYVVSRKYRDNIKNI